MNTNIRPSADPYGGARQAFRALSPTATDQHWEDWISEQSKDANGEFDNFDALARLCTECLAGIDGLSAEQAVMIGWSAGYFEAMGSVTRAVIDMLPTSSSVPQHFKRYRSNLRNFPERYADEA